MKDARKRIEEAFAGIKSERTPIYDLICNDATIEHFAGGKLDGSKDEEVVVKALTNMLDGTRDMSVPNPMGKTWMDKAGNEIEAQRWTCWVKTPAHADDDGWAGWIDSDIARLEAESSPSAEEIQTERDRQIAVNERFDGTVYIHSTPSISVNEAMFGYHCGLDYFSFLWHDHKELMTRWLKAIEDAEIRKIEKTAHADLCPMSLIYSDIAFKGGLMLGREGLRDVGFFENLERIVDALHQRGVKAIFHSDGNVMDVMDDLVKIGIDGFNPIEKAARMDAYELRRLYPELTLVGGLDVTDLLPNGTPDEVRKETRRMIDELGAEGRLLIGTTTELDNAVSLENYLAFHDEVMRG